MLPQADLGKLVESAKAMQLRMVSESRKLQDVLQRGKVLPIAAKGEGDAG